MRIVLSWFGQIETKWKELLKIFAVTTRGGSRPKLKGGQLGMGAPKIQSKVSAQKFLEPYSRKFSGFSTEWRLSLCVSSHSERNTEKRARLGQVKGRFSCQKGGAKSEFSS